VTSAPTCTATAANSEPEPATSNSRQDQGHKPPRRDLGADRHAAHAQRAMSELGVHRRRAMATPGRSLRGRVSRVARWTLCPSGFGYRGYPEFGELAVQRDKRCGVGEEVVLLDDLAPPRS
jgi:hypothetical protein